MSGPEITYDLELLERSQAKWRSSPALRAVYGAMLEEMRRELLPGRTLELGSGIGLATEFIPDLVTSDIVRTRFVERAVSAYEIPREGWANIIAFDVLHHLCTPLRFFASAAAAVVPGGRIVLMEPAGTPGGRAFYSLFHPEPCHPADIVAPFEFTPAANGEFANMGMAHGLFTAQRKDAEARLAPLGLRMVSVHYRDLLAYPLTGGFSRPALLPATLLRGMLAVEERLPQWVLRFLALRMVVVVEKTAGA